MRRRRFDPTSVLMVATPVTLPPGRLRLLTRPPQRSKRNLYSITHQRERAARHLEVRGVEVRFAQ
jgi:hypothetical protein